MPLKSGSSKAVVSDNIREFSHGKTFEKTSAKFGASKAHKQAVAVALRTARKSKRGK